jgi:methionyl aminopeptidase
MKERLTEGLVVAVEPIISALTSRHYELSNGWTRKAQDSSWADHHEHTIVITRMGSKLMQNR